jgi:hypothetical protein
VLEWFNRVSYKGRGRRACECRVWRIRRPVTRSGTRRIQCALSPPAVGSAGWCRNRGCPGPGRWIRACRCPDCHRHGLRGSAGQPRCRRPRDRPHIYRRGLGLAPRPRRLRPRARLAGARHRHESAPVWSPQSCPCASVCACGSAAMTCRCTACAIPAVRAWLPHMPELRFCSRPRAP